MIIHLKDPKTNITAAIDSVGAQLISLKDSSGKEYIWQRDPSVWSSCSPLLFPSVGNCRDGRTQFDGQWYSMPKHGLCRKADFAPEHPDGSHAVFRFISNDQTRCSYPYDFILSLSYELKNGILFMDYSIENIGNREACYCIGSHPGFICPLEEDERFEDYQLEFEHEENTYSMVYDLKAMEFDAASRGIELDHIRILPLNYELFKNDAVYFDRIVSRKVSIISSKTGKGVQISYPGFETVAFWTPYDAKAPFLCVEPWNGSAIRSDEDNDFAHRHHVQVLTPGETRNHHMEIKLILN